MFNESKIQLKSLKLKNCHTLPYLLGPPNNQVMAASAAAVEQLKAVFVASTSAVAAERDGATAQLVQVQ